MSQAPKLEELEIPNHTELAVDLHDAEQILFKVVQMLNRLDFKSHKHFKKGCRQRADVIYTQARLLRESDITTNFNLVRIKVADICHLLFTIHWDTAPIGPIIVEMFTK